MKAPPWHHSPRCAKSWEKKKHRTLECRLLDMLVVVLRGAMVLKPGYVRMNSIARANMYVECS